MRRSRPLHLHSHLHLHLHLHLLVLFLATSTAWADEPCAAEVTAAAALHPVSNIGSSRKKSRSAASPGTLK